MSSYPWPAAGRTIRLLLPVSYRTLLPLPALITLLEPAKRSVSLPVPVVIVLPPTDPVMVSVPPVAVTVLPEPPMDIVWLPDVAVMIELLTFSTALAVLPAIVIVLTGLLMVTLVDFVAAT